MRLDEVDGMAAPTSTSWALAIFEHSDDDTTGRADGAPPALRGTFVAAEARGNGDAAFYLERARMSFITVHAS